MKRLISLLQNVLEESGTWCRTSTTKDFETVLSRIEHEGLSFLTITLPAFGKDLEKALDQRHVGPSQFAAFRRRGELPAFLGGFLDLVFDRDTGVLRNIDNMTSSERIDHVVAIRCLRQITLMFGKLNDECSEKRTRAAINQYIVCEREVKEVDATFQGPRHVVKTWEVPEDASPSVWEATLRSFEQDRSWRRNS